MTQLDIDKSPRTLHDRPATLTKENTNKTNDGNDKINALYRIFFHCDNAPDLYFSTTQHDAEIPRFVKRVSTLPQSNESSTVLSCRRQIQPSFLTQAIEPEFMENIAEAVLYSQTIDAFYFQLRFESGISFRFQKSMEAMVGSGRYHYPICTYPSLGGVCLLSRISTRRY
jgi:hypothetical protein